MYFIGSIVIFFFAPLIVLIILYCIIARNLMTNAAALGTNKRIDNYSIRARRQVILMLGTVVLSFFLCLIPFRVFTIWIIVVPTEYVLHLGIERYYNILYFCRILVYLNSAINPILYNLMSSKFRTGFIICSDSKRRSRFKRVRNGTFSTTANSCRSSTFRHSHDGYKVCYRSPRNNSFLLKQCGESPNSTKITDSPCYIARENTKRHSDHVRNGIDEEIETNSSDSYNCKESLNPNVFTEEVLICHETSNRRILNSIDENSRKEIPSI
ncbi:hypothetical protein HHI36_008128 [Cryptolaemus montrouzieri]|uniref:G-protein coupled receptors family 1 profile domain-containing protein n=1 Tax=Cryptolaemus montrouzieri TaxID=559131 RepID=A0ABD2MS45_9CUCU